MDKRDIDRDDDDDDCVACGSGIEIDTTATER